jgi:metallo-beta-lactamase class B
MPAAMRQLWDTWEDPEQQVVKPFKIFDNVYYVGIDWVAAYVIDTGEGLILIDSLYGKWVRRLFRNFAALGLNPADVKYVIITHGHFDHAGGAVFFQHTYGAQVVMAAEDWTLAEAEPAFAAFYVPIPTRDMVAEDGYVIELGDTHIELFKTPGHTEGALSLRYQVRDGDRLHTAMTLGGVGLNFSGTERTHSYIESYRRLQSMQDDIEVSLPNHAAMAGVFERAELLQNRQPGEPHPFVDADAYQASLARLIANAELKLEQE